MEMSGPAFVFTETSLPVAFASPARPAFAVEGGGFRSWFGPVLRLDTCRGEAAGEQRGAVWGASPGEPRRWGLDAS